MDEVHLNALRWLDGEELSDEEITSICKHVTAEKVALDTTGEEPRCSCGRRLGMWVPGGISIRCQRCKASCIVRLRERVE